MAECKDCVSGVLGVCRDYCAFERELLEDQARALAESHGHELGPWSKVKGLAHWQARCNRCNQSLTISLTPGPGDTELSGSGLTSPCLPSSA